MADAKDRRERGMLAQALCLIHNAHCADRDRLAKPADFLPARYRPARPPTPAAERFAAYAAFFARRQG